MATRIVVAPKPEVFDAQGHIDSLRILDALGLDVEVLYRKVFTSGLELS